VERANIQNRLLDFVRDQNLPLALYQGICHQLLAEHPRVAPGRVIVGADSHTVTAGALGCFATGVGSSDFLTALTTGRLWFRVPATIAVRLRGRVPAYIQGKDVMLALARILGDDGAVYRCLEFHDETENGLTMDSRLTISNMSVELGAKAGIFVPDQITEAYVRAKHAEWNPIVPDGGAVYERTVTLDLTDLEPLVALPHGFECIVPARQLADVPVTQVFIGSCTGGRLEDIASAAVVLKRHPIKPYMKMIVIPASNSVAQAAMAEGYIQACMASGAVVANSSCGPCAAIDKGIVGDGEVCLSTASRNFQGRMGALGSDVYVCSSLTATASAVHGRITDPREVLS